MLLYSWGQKFTSPFQNLQNVNYFTKIRGIIQNACYYLFSVFVFSDSVSWVPCLSWTVKLSAVLQKNPHNFFGFPAFLCIWTLSNNDCMILRSIFSQWGQLKDSYATITKGVDHSGNGTVLRIKGMHTFERCHFYKFKYYFLLWTICKHLLCEISYSGQY